MSKAEIRERERRWAPWVVAATVLVLAMFIAGNLVNQSVAPASDASEADNLDFFNADSSTLLLAFVLQGLGIALLAVPLLYLFKATHARSETLRSAMVGVVVAGPIFLGLAQLAAWVGLDAVAGDFVAAGGAKCPLEGSLSGQDDCITDLISGNGVVGVAQGLQLAGVIGILAGLVYTSLNAMRVGLLTRFFGTLGMALGVSVLFLGPLGIVVYVLGLALVFINRWPGGRPAAWDAAEAIPWPKPGEEPPEPPRVASAEIEGTAEEILGTDQPSGNGSKSSGPERRKRKRR